MPALTLSTPLHTYHFVLSFTSFLNLTRQPYNKSLSILSERLASILIVRSETPQPILHSGHLFLLTQPLCLFQFTYPWAKLNLLNLSSDVQSLLGSKIKPHPLQFIVKSDCRNVWMWQSGKYIKIIKTDSRCFSCNLVTHLYSGTITQATIKNGFHIGHASNDTGRASMCWP